jgi:hypothetical protein
LANKTVNSVCGGWIFSEDGDIGLKEAESEEYFLSRFTIEKDGVVPSARGSGGDGA